MSLSLRNLNIASDYKSREMIKKKAVSVSPPTFNQTLNSHASDISFRGKSPSGILKKLTKSTSVFSNANQKEKLINDLFGGELVKIQDELFEIWGKKGYEARIKKTANDVITLTDDGILPKFFKSALYPVKDLWLDITNWALGGLSKVKKIKPVSNFAKKGLELGPLKKRANTKKAEELFCIIQGAYADISKGEAPVQRKAIKKVTQKLTGALPQAEVGKKNGAETILQNMLHATGSVKGNYKTADERTINRICTGLVSASMAGIDFYNISRMQNDDDALAKKSQKKRFKQESSRILMSAAMTFLTLGALSKYANANKYIALATITGTTLVSEVLSRIFGGMPLRPLSPDEARIYAQNQHGKKKAKKSDKADKVVEQPKVINSKDTPEIFTKFLTGSQNVSQSANNSVAAKPQEMKFKGADKEKTKEKEADILNLSNFLKLLGGLFGAGMVVCIARCRSKRFDEMLKRVRRGMDDAYDMITKKDYLVPLDRLNSIVNKIDKDYNMHQYAQKYREAINSDDYKRVIKKIGGKDVEYIKLGSVDKKVIAPLVKAITYPFGFVWGVIRFPVKTVRTIFQKEGAKGSSGVKKEDLIGFYKTFDKAVKKAESGKMTDNELQNYIKRKIIMSVEDKTGKSTYKNSSLAAISRPFVTLIASYFFVNDYRNEVLIASQGKDVEGANAVAKERIMHKVSNFFFNSMFMNLFNSVFETAYHGSLIGAGAVAAATEFTNENTIRKSIGVPTRKMTKAQIEEHDRQNLTRDDFWGKYFRFMSKLTGKKTISQKAQDEAKKKAQKANENQK